ncbi:MAG: hypothetical protein PWQ10_425 [Patescibacteria group bacterium]|nr:hypothetical protein [Patescibacteria group bacterium]
MQPDQQSDKQNESPEMYTPEPVFEDSIHVSNVEDLKKTVSDSEPIHWSAKEYIYVEKNGLWFFVFVAVSLAFIAVDVFFIKSYTFSVLVIVMALSVIVYSRRPPRVIDYTLSGSQGLYIGEKLYHFNEFKSFGLIRDGEYNSIIMIPTKRFALGVSVYFPQEAGEKIIDILGARLPMETRSLDFIDKIVRKLRL